MDMGRQPATLAKMRLQVPQAEDWSLHSGIQEPAYHAGMWFLRSGIQETNGGVARYYRADLQRNLPVSTEITGYAISALIYLHSITHDAQYLERAADAA